jgi:hypothetical protein
MKLPATFWKWTASSRFPTFTYSEPLQVLGAEIVSGFSQHNWKFNEAACLALGSMLQVQLQQHFRWILPCTKSSAGTRSLWLRCQVAVAILFQLHTILFQLHTSQIQTSKRMCLNMDAVLQFYTAGGKQQKRCRFKPKAHCHNGPPRECALEVQDRL